MADLTRYTRKRTRSRAGCWALIFTIILAGLYAANVLLPGESRQPFRARPSVNPIAVPEGLVEEVIDGDTIILAGGVPVRLNGLDTPETEQLGYEEAKRALAGLVQGRKVRLAYGAGDKVDRYGRLLAYLSTEASTNVNEEMLRLGMGWLYKMDDGEDGLLDRFLAAQRNALDAGRGIWAEFSDCAGPLPANGRSRVFHKESCPFGKTISPKNHRTFESMREAFRHGYSPCRRCFQHPLEGR